MWSLWLLSIAPCLIRSAQFKIPTKFWLDIQSQAQTFHLNCPNGWLTITDQTGYEEVSSQTPRMVWDQAPKRSLPVDTFCALTVMDGLTLARTKRFLQRVKPFRDGVTVLLTDGSISKAGWLKMASETHYAFFVAQLNGTTRGTLSLICPFVEDHATDFEIQWNEQLGFHDEFPQVMKAQCYHKFDGYWPIVYREVHPMTVIPPDNLQQVTGFESDFVRLLKEHLHITTAFIQDNGSLPSLPNGQRIPSIIHSLYSHEARMIFGATPAHVNFYTFGDPSVTIYTSTPHYCSRVPQPLPNYQNLLKVFPLNVWLIMLWTNLICSLVMYGIYRFYASHDIMTYPTIGSMKARLVDFLVRINIGIMEPDAIPWFKTHSAGSFFSGTFYIYATFLGFFYTSMFLATLVSVEREPPVNSASDALARGANVYINNLLSMARPELESFERLPKAVREVGLMAIRRGTVYNDRDGEPDIGMEEIVTKGASFVVGVPKTSSVSIVTPRWYGKYIGTEPIHAPWQLVVFFPKYAPWGPLVNNLTMRIVDSGIMDHLPSSLRIIKTKEEDRFEAIRLEQLWTAFILLLGGSTLATLAFLFELLKTNCKSRWGLGAEQ